MNNMFNIIKSQYLDEDFAINPKIIIDRNWNASVVAHFMDAMHGEWASYAIDKLSSDIYAIKFNKYQNDYRVLAAPSRDDIVSVFNSYSNGFSLIITDERISFLIFQDISHDYLLYAGEAAFLSRCLPYTFSTLELMHNQVWCDEVTMGKRTVAQIAWEKYYSFRNR